MKRRVPAALLLCVSLPAAVAAQQKPNRAAQEVTSTASIVLPSPDFVPDLRWLTRNEAEAVLERMQLRAEVSGDDTMVFFSIEIVVASLVVRLSQLFRPAPELPPGTRV